MLGLLIVTVYGAPPPLIVKFSSSPTLAVAASGLTASGVMAAGVTVVPIVTVAPSASLTTTAADPAATPVTSSVDPATVAVTNATLLLATRYGVSPPPIE
jgi:hypothetical protein